MAPPYKPIIPDKVRQGLRQRLRLLYPSFSERDVDLLTMQLIDMMPTNDLAPRQVAPPTDFNREVNFWRDDKPDGPSPINPINPIRHKNDRLPYPDRYLTTDLIKPDGRTNQMAPLPRKGYEMNDVFTDKMMEAEKNLRKRKGMGPPKTGPKATGKKAGSSGDVPIRIGSDYVKIGHVEVPTSQTLKELEDATTANTKKLISQLPQVQLNKTLTVKTQLGEVIGKVKGMRHRQTEMLIRCMEIRGYGGHRKNIMIKGPMGGGKSTATRQGADALGLEYRYTGQTEMKGDVLGVVHAVSGDYLPSQFVETYINGGVWVGEELDGWSPRATLALNVPLANGYIVTPDGKHHKRHPDCVIVACTNTWGNGATSEYVGRNKLDAAFVDRFSPRIDWEYDADLEAAAANNEEVVAIVQQARMNAETHGIKVVISPRSSINISDMVKAGIDLREALSMDFLAGMDRSQTKRLLEGASF